MSSQATTMPVLGGAEGPALSRAEGPLAQPTPLALFVTFWHHATLFAHLATLAAAAFSVGCGFMSLEMARWGMNVLAGAARSAE